MVRLGSPVRFWLEAPNYSNLLIINIASCFSFVCINDKKILANGLAVSMIFESVQIPKYIGVPTEFTVL